jgi:BirA family biotin operon repressor/biotin-[acetyl-CoA-carboxylase] ligase
MHKGQFDLLSAIADGHFHSGQELAAKLKVSRAAIWKSIKQIESLGLPVEAVRGKGYCLVAPVELLSEDLIKASLTSQAKQYCNNIEVLFKTSSTNAILLNQLATAEVHGKVVLAEYQSEGRGRRGKKWVSPLASGISLSVAWHFDIAPGALGLLSLYMGVAVARTLLQSGLIDVSLKWPNDVVVNDKKLGGILLELRGEASGPVDVVVGIGLNYNLPSKIISDIDQAVCDICNLSNKRLSRNYIVATLLSNVFEVLHDVQAGVSTKLIDEWRQFDHYRGREAKLVMSDKKIEGVLKGVDDQGQLLMLVDGVVERYTAGEISLRLKQ